MKKLTWLMIALISPLFANTSSANTETQAGWCGWIMESGKTDCINDMLRKHLILTHNPEAALNISADCYFDENCYNNIHAYKTCEHTTTVTGDNNEYLNIANCKISTGQPGLVEWAKVTDNNGEDGWTLKATDE